MERVYRDGADVLNLSIGEALNSWPDSPVARAASRLVDKGIVVVVGGRQRPRPRPLQRDARRASGSA